MLFISIRYTHHVGIPTPLLSNQPPTHLDLSEHECNNPWATAIHQMPALTEIHSSTTLQRRHADSNNPLLVKLLQACCVFILTHSVLPCVSAWKYCRTHVNHSSYGANCCGTVVLNHRARLWCGFEPFIVLKLLGVSYQTIVISALSWDVHQSS